MPYVPAGGALTFRQTVKGFVGIVASKLWAFPELAKRLHAWRGTRFSDRRSVFLGYGVVFDNRYPELIEIGRDVWIAGGSKIICHAFVTRLQAERYGMQEQVAGVVIHDGVLIGANSILLPGTELGECCYVGANSVVSGVFPAGVLIAGVPARIVRPLGPPASSAGTAG